jgi:hypothetical protein
VRLETSAPRISAVAGSVKLWRPANLTNTDWREAQFADNSCVRSELGRAVGCLARPGKQTQHASDAVPSIHFTPGSPFGVRAGLQLFF